MPSFPFTFVTRFSSPSSPIMHRVECGAHIMDQNVIHTILVPIQIVFSIISARTTRVQLGHTHTRTQTIASRSTLQAPQHRGQVSCTPFKPHRTIGQPIFPPVTPPTATKQTGRVLFGSIFSPGYLSRLRAYGLQGYCRDISRFRQLDQPI